MTDFELVKLPFTQREIQAWSHSRSRADNWPVVYTLSSEKEIYVGETVSAVSRLSQHLGSPSKQSLSRVEVIFNEKFNKSVCLDLESKLIQLFSADGFHRVLNANVGITNADYYNRDEYRETFNELFQILVDEGLLSRPVPEIINSNLFKFSPFKALTHEQASALSACIERMILDLKSGSETQLVIQGDPGTGKTIVAIYLIKLLRDIAHTSREELSDQDSMFSEFFTPGNAELFANLRMGLVVPQQALRKTLQNVFSQIPGLDKGMVLTPFEVGKSQDDFDLLVVDEAHRLGQRANQSSAAQNKDFTSINIRLYGHDDLQKTQLDWIATKSRHQLLLLDTGQSIKPADLPFSLTSELVARSKSNDSHFKLASQMRVMGGEEYLDFVKVIFSNDPTAPGDFKGYDLRFYEDFAVMRDDVLHLDAEYGLCRLLAGFAWPWTTKHDKSAEAFDIEIEGLRLRWNQSERDWVNSSESQLEVGSIHTIQGYDLNYAGVIIGNDIGYDPVANQIFFRREQYFDIKGRENNKKLGIDYSDDDILQWVLNIYRVLLTRGIRGTFVYVCDPELRKLLKTRFVRN